VIKLVPVVNFTLLKKRKKKRVKKLMAYHNVRIPQSTQTDKNYQQSAIKRKHILPDLALEKSSPGPRMEKRKTNTHSERQIF